MDPTNESTGKIVNEPIPLPQSSNLQDLVSQVRDAQKQLNTYVAGIKDALDVPEDWKVDLQRGAFVPPPNGNDQ